VSSVAANAVAALIRFSGLAWIVRNTVARNRVSIVVYHDPAPVALDAQVEYLTRRYTVIPLRQLVDAVRSGDWSEIPAKSVVITLDDGRVGNRRLAEVFETHGVRPTVYLCSQIVDTGRAFWFMGMGAEVVERLKALPNEARLEELSREHGFEQTAEHPRGQRQALNRTEVEAMQASCDFGSHTRFHPTLTACPEPVAEQEIAASKLEVEKLTGGACDHFAYPGGASSGRVVELVKRAGYLSARTVDIGWNHRRSDPYRLKIMSIDRTTPTTLAADLAGLKWLTRLVSGKGGIRGERVIPASSADLG
jgi:peptidoglycan/xylan/chitin deacetylase (PgdA/CDA1 family)